MLVFVSFITFALDAVRTRVKLGTWRELAPWSRAHLEKLKDTQVARKSSSRYD
jgi:hypothetical protein